MIRMALGFMASNFPTMLDLCFELFRTTLAKV